MAYEEAKVYFDGSHYIAIPKHDRPASKRGACNIELEEKKAAFEKAYRSAKARKRNEKVTEIAAAIQPHFENPDEARAFVLANLQRMKRNMIVRRMRLARKINMDTWNYFCTFTYDDQKHTEESFKKSLSNCFKKLCHRKEWVYIGVWERAPETGRLHFHGIFYIPEGGMVGQLEKHRDYSFATRSRKVTLQNTYFNRRFGRSDFSPIDCRQQLGSAMAYLMKYIAKSQERIVYSRGTHAYFISDILDNDVACTMGEDDPRLILFDNFSCFDKGVYVGQVSPEVIQQMPKSN